MVWYNGTASRVAAAGIPLHVESSDSTYRVYHDMECPCGILINNPYTAFIISHLLWWWTRPNPRSTVPSNFHDPHKPLGFVRYDLTTLGHLMSMAERWKTRSFTSLYHVPSRPGHREGHVFRPDGRLVDGPHPSQPLTICVRMFPFGPQAPYWTTMSAAYLCRYTWLIRRKLGLQGCRQRPLMARNDACSGMLSWFSRTSSPAKSVLVLHMLSYLRILLPRTQPTLPSRPARARQISGSPKSPDGEPGIL